MPAITLVTGHQRAWQFLDDFATYGPQHEQGMGFLPYLITNEDGTPAALVAADVKVAKLRVLMDRAM